MRFSRELTDAQRSNYDHSWNRWFAWRPICIKGRDYVWLEVVERKLEASYESLWEYRLINKEEDV